MAIHLTARLRPSSIMTSGWDRRRSAHIIPTGRMLRFDSSGTIRAATLSTIGAILRTSPSGRLICKLRKAWAIGGRFFLADNTETPDTLDLIYEFPALDFTYMLSPLPLPGFESMGNIGCVFQGTEATLAV